MNTRRRSALYWAPRVLGIGTAIFQGVFALDVFGEGYALGELLVAFVMHLLPSLLILIVLAISWRWERIGGILFVLLGMMYIVMFWDPGRWFVYLVMAGPLFVTGMLFMLDEWLTREMSVSSGGNGAAE